jgi:hypothetical protein
MINSEITEQYLNQVYDALQREQLKLMNDMKSGNSEAKEKEITKQITTINTINLNIMRLRNIRKKKDLE